MIVLFNYFRFSVFLSLSLPQFHSAFLSFNLVQQKKRKESRENRFMSLFTFLSNHPRFQRGDNEDEEENES